jgi:hypothetical protein
VNPDAADVAAAVGALRLYTGQISASVDAWLRASWAVLADVSDEVVWPWAAEATHVVEGAQATVGAATDAYLAELLGRAPLGVAPADVSTMALRGVDGAEVWTRPPRDVRWRLAEGDNWAVARRKGLDRALGLADTNLQLAHTHTARNVLTRHGTGAGYRRVTRGGRSCQLCLLAATRVYKRDELLPIHTHCHCVVAPATGAGDQPLLTSAGRAARDDAEAAGVEVAVHEHGEVGPVLYRAGDSFAAAPDPGSVRRIDSQTAAVEAAMAG